jgi:hypothetical protein
MLEHPNMAADSLKKIIHEREQEHKVEAISFMT